jgi:hypothetical protein
MTHPKIAAMLLISIVLGAFIKFIAIIFHMEDWMYYTISGFGVYISYFLPDWIKMKNNVEVNIKNDPNKLLGAP